MLCNFFICQNKKEKTMSEKTNKQELYDLARKNMILWLNSLQSRDPKKVAKMYADEASFLPTVSGDFKHGCDGAEDYFKHFLAKNPTGKVVEEEVNFISPDCYLHVGMYDFTLDSSPGRSCVHARFDYLWKKDKKSGEWKIIHHHSSLRPKEK